MLMKAFYLCVLLFVTSILYAQKPGTLDKTFGRKGRQWDTVGRYADIRAMVIQPDGKIVIGAPGAYKGNTTYRVDRLLADGTPDISFGTSGSVIIPLPFSNKKSKAYVTYLALTADGKILAGGNSSYIVKLTTKGVVDSSFGTNGLTQLYIGNYGNAMLVQPDGRFVIGGNTFINNETSRVVLQRFLPNGNPDITFGDSGAIRERYGQISALALLPNGKIVAAGFSGDAYRGSLKFLIERYNTNGKLDKTFSGDGVVDTAVVPNTCYITDLAIQPDGKILVSGGTYVEPGYPHFTVARYNKNGSIDTSFGTGGLAITLFPANSGGDLAQADKVMLWNDKIIAAGYNDVSSFYNHSDLALVSYNTNGTLDSSFGNNGVQHANYEYNEFTGSAALQPDGKIILLGLGRDEDQTYEVRNLLRYNGYPAQPLATASEKDHQSIPAIAPSLRMYPNPASDYITITGLPANAQSTITITDGLGKAIALYSTTNTAQYKVDVSKLTAGIYYARVQANGKREVLKFVKE